MKYLVFLLLCLWSQVNSFSITKKWANGSYTAFNVRRHNKSDLVNITAAFDKIEQSEWYKGEAPTMASVFVPIWVALGAGQSIGWELEMYNAACYYNRTVDEGKVYRDSELNEKLDPCIEYAKKYHAEVQISPQYTIDHIIKNSHLVGKYYDPIINKNPCVRNRRSLIRKSFDYNSYVEELGQYLSVADTKISSEFYDIVTKHGHVYCKPKYFERCYMNKNMFIARCIVAHTHFKNMKIY